MIGPTAKSLLVGGGGSARAADALGSVFDELKRRRTAALTCDRLHVEGGVVPTNAMN